MRCVSVGVVCVVASAEHPYLQRDTAKHLHELGEAQDVQRASICIAGAHNNVTCESFLVPTTPYHVTAS